jgi:hypothetical protein
MTMGMYPEPSCPDRLFSMELDDTEINTRIWGGRDGFSLMGLI